jgi:hypothetical protein
VTTREAAATGQMPAWFPAVAAVSFTVAMALIGWSWLIGGGHGTARVVGLCGAAMIVFHLALTPALVMRWRRDGVVPRAGGCAPAERRRRSVWMAAVGLVVSAALWIVTGNVGWAAISVGVLFGVETWYRLTGMRLQ